MVNDGTTKDVNNGLNDIVIVPNYLFGNRPLDPLLDDIDISQRIGNNRVKTPIQLSSSIMVPDIPPALDTESKKALIYVSTLIGIPFNLDPAAFNEDLFKFIDEVGASFMCIWNATRAGLKVELLNKSCGVEIDINALIHQSDPKKPSGRVRPPMHLDIESPKDLKKQIDLLKEVTDGRVPISVQIGPGNVYGDVKYAIKAGADAVVIEAMAVREQDAHMPPPIGIPLAGLLKPTQKALKETSAHDGNVSLLIKGPFDRATDIFKVLAMGADAVALDEGSVVALLGRSKGKGWKAMGEGFSEQLKAMEQDLLKVFAMTANPNKKTLSTECLRATTYDAASVTGLKLIGYEKELPMWMH